MRKSYDKEEWIYLRAIMRKLGFSNAWVDLVMRLVSSVSFAVLFNGSPREEFRLSCLLKRNNQSPTLHGLKVAPAVLAVNHLLFADDSLMFFQASSVGALALKDVLDKYCNSSGQRINMGKIFYFLSKGCPEGVREVIKNTLEVQRETLKEKYLGMPSDVGKEKGGAFKYLRDWLWKKILGLIEQLFSVGGKEVLTKAVAQAVSTFSMSCFKLPKGLCEHINSMIHKF
jgi:hypothetical protein